jgi:hypothetical protein
MNDCSGLWLFACFKEDCFIDSLRVGFMLGFYEGIDYGLDSIYGDPNKVTIRLEILTKEGLYTYIDQRFDRNDFRCSIEKLWIKISDRLEITQNSDNEINWKFFDNTGKFCINLNLKVNSYYLYPSLILPNNFDNMIVAPNVDISGEVNVKGIKAKVFGMGALDQNWSRKIKSNSAHRYGYSHYEPIFWNNEFTSVLYYVVSSNKKLVLHDLILSKNHKENIVLDKITVNHISYENVNGTLNPMRYRVKARSEEINMDYLVDIIPRKRLEIWGYPDILLKTWVPNMPLISAKGIIKEHSKGNIKKINIIGKGILEFIRVDLNPFIKAKKIM